ncbi:MAG: hypothetical protein C0616_09185 [Desulfuromonas sp.]|nr:MAG: hypothetical protein C0616_09185 [Desulfuromonas sp.]
MKQILIKLIGVLVCSALVAPMAMGNTGVPPTDLLTHYHLEIGYQGDSESGNPLYAAPFHETESGPVGVVEMLRVDPRFRGHLEADYRSESEQYGQFDLDYRGLLRLRASAEKFIHRLDHLPFDGESRPAASRMGDGSDPEILANDLDPAGEYQNSIERGEVSVKAKIPKFPAHVGVDYWRWEKQGDQQHRFLVEGADSTPQSCNGCHLTSTKKRIDRTTEQVKLTLDAHLGYIDVNVVHAIRDFRENADPPRDTFGSQFYDIDPPIEYRSPGDYQHDVTPDSKLQYTRIEAHSSLSSGLVGLVGATFGERTNEGALADKLSSRPETDFRMYSGDLIYTPWGGLRLQGYFRLLDLETETPAFQSVEGHGVDAIISDPIDVRRNLYGVRAAWDLNERMLLRGELKQSDNRRSDVFQDGNRRWNVEEDEQETTTRWTLRVDLLERRRLRWETRYRYRHVVDPAYGNTAENEHHAFTGLSWTGQQQGGVVHLNYQHGRNSDFNLLIEPNADGQYLQLPYGFQRNNWNVSFNGWWNPIQNLSMQWGGGYQWTDIDQELVFGSDPNPDINIEASSTEYRHDQLSFYLQLATDITEQIQGNVGYRYERADGRVGTEFTERELAYLGFPTTVVSVDDSDMLKGNTFDYASDSFHFELRWKPDPVFHLTTAYDLSRYRDHIDDRTDGEIQTFLLSLGMLW